MVQDINKNNKYNYNLIEQIKYYNNFNIIQKIWVCQIDQMK